MPDPVRTFTLPTSITAIKTAVPVFIGFTEKHTRKNLNVPTLITSIIEYESFFGRPQPSRAHLHLHDDNTLNGPITISQPSFRMHYAIRVYFANGGAPCYIVSAGTYKTANASKSDLYTKMKQAISALEDVNGPTLLVFPDASLLVDHSLSETGKTILGKTNLYHEICNDALNHCSQKKNRFAILDIWHPFNTTPADTFKYISEFREAIIADDGSYGAAYYPWLHTTITPYVNEKADASLTVHGGSGIPKRLTLRKEDTAANLTNSLYHINRFLYDEVQKAITSNPIILPPSPVAAAVYCSVDSSSGVWKAPANVSLQSISKPGVSINDAEQEMLNMDLLSGKSINAIRAFPGRGVLVWGARTLAGNSNDWRYIPVRRFFIMVEQSITTAIKPFAFEPNDANTWTLIKGLAWNFLFQQWKTGALQGVKPEHAFFVKIGLGETMTAQDILDGKLIVEIGMAVVRPAEFVTMRIAVTMNS